MFSVVDEILDLSRASEDVHVFRRGALKAALGGHGAAGDVIGAGIVGLKGVGEALGVFVPSHEKHSLLQTRRHRGVAQDAMKQISPDEKPRDDIEGSEGDKKAGNGGLEFENEGRIR